MKNYFKYFFSRLEHWLMTFIILIVWTISLYHTQGGTIFWVIPIGLYIGRSILMYKEKKNKTSS